MPRDGDIAVREGGDLEERPGREVEVVLVRAGHAHVRDGDGDALPVVRVRERDRAAAVRGDLRGGAVARRL